MSHVAPPNLTTDHSAPRLPTHCVFRSGTAWQALPATAIREVMPRPEMIRVPGTPPTFIGMCHVRSEFIPVLDLKAVLAEGDQPTSWADSRNSNPRNRAANDNSAHQAFSTPDEPILILLDDKDGAWAILVDEVISLQRLESSDAPQRDAFDSFNAVVGWATFSGSVIQILDQARIRQLAEQDLSLMWQSNTTSQ